MAEGLIGCDNQATTFIAVGNKLKENLKERKGSSLPLAYAEPQINLLCECLQFLVACKFPFYSLNSTAGGAVLLYAQVGAYLAEGLAGVLTHAVDSRSLASLLEKGVKSALGLR